MISCTILNFSASFCATCSNPSFIFIKGVHSVAFTSNPENAFVFFPVSTLQSGKAFLHHFLCSMCRHGVLLAPSFLWLAIPTATGLVFLLAFLLRPARFVSFSAKIFTHSSHVLIFSYHLPKPSTVRLLPREMSPLLIWQRFSPFSFRESL